MSDSWSRVVAAVVPAVMVGWVSGVATAATAGEEQSATQRRLPPGYVGRYMERANAQGVAGETNSLQLSPPGIFINPYYNDVSGGTDKLLTASAKVGALWQWSDSSYELIYRWRFLTPAFEHAFAHARNAHPTGRYADWMEVSNAYARTVGVLGQRMKLQATLGLNHVGNKGAKQVHYWIHKETHNQVEDLKYTDQPEGKFLNEGVLAAWLAPTVRLGRVEVEAAPGLGMDQSKFLTEAYVTLPAVGAVRRGVWEVAAELRVVRQLQSEVYEGIRPYRYEAAVGTLFFQRYKPTIKFVSTYLRGDPIGQTYFDFLNVQIPF
jgi:hypothetical protein